MSKRKPTPETGDLEPPVCPESATAHPPVPPTTSPVTGQEPPRKTAVETAGLSLIPQPHGGALLSGGVPGNNGGGRKPKDFIAWCQEVIDDEKARGVYEARNRAGDLDVLKLAAAYAKGKPRETVEISGKDGGPIEQVWVFGKREIKF